MNNQKREIAVPLWKHNSGHLTGNLGPFEIAVYPEDNGANLCILTDLPEHCPKYLLETKTSPKGLVYFKLGVKGFDFTLFKNESNHPNAPAYRLLISQWKPKEDKPAPSKSSWDNTPTSVQAPVKAFSETTFGEEDVPF